MANAWRRGQASSTTLFSPKNIFLFISTSLLLLTFLYLASQTQTPPPRPKLTTKLPLSTSQLHPFDCYTSPQAHPVIANLVEGLKYPFLFSLSDFGDLPEKPHKNIVRTLKGKAFRKPDISETVQGLFEKWKRDGKEGIFVDVGANVGMASFAAAVMGFRVLAFEPIFENLQKICEGVYFNRVGELMHVFQAAVSDQLGNITVYKLVGRLDNSAVSATGANLAFKSNKEVAVQVKTIPLDEIIRDDEPVLLLKIDVQGWEYHVLKGAPKLLSRKKGEAPYIIYEEDERLLKASNSTAKEIRDYLHTMGYNHCTQHGTDAHCTK